MPASMKKAEKIIKDLLLPTKEYHVCQNDCMVLSEEHADLSHCPVCGSSRYKDGGRVPRIKFTYLPLIPLLRQTFEIPGVAKALQSHWPRPRADDGVMRDIHDLPAWAEAYEPGGPNEPGIMNPYLRPFVNEMLMLEKGVLIYDASRDRNINVRADIMLHVMDSLEFPEAKPETRGRLPIKTKDEMLVYGKIYDELSTPALRNLISKATGKTSVEELYRLEPHTSEKYAPESMHLSGDATCRFRWMVSGDTDTLKVQKAEQQLKRLPSTWPINPATAKTSTEVDKKTSNKKKKKVICGPVSRVADSRTRPKLPPAIWALKTAEKIKVDNRLACIKFATDGIFKYAVHGLLAENQRRTLCKLCDAIGALTHPTAKKEKIPNIQAAVDVCLALMERDYSSHDNPPAFAPALVPGEIRASTRQLDVVFEQLMHVMTTRVASKRYPEASALESLLGRNGNANLSRCRSYFIEGLAKYYLATNSTYTALLRTETTMSRNRLPLKSWRPKGHCLTEYRGHWRDRQVPAPNAKKWEKVAVGTPPLEGFGQCFARVQFFVRHRFLVVEMAMTYVKWLPRAERDDDTNLFVIDTELPSPQHQPFLPLEDLTHPLVTAVEPADGHLWILNFDNVLVDS
ncbi:Hypp707 [Branchiostoma lanceolatum]|uniref:Hypp707 protein n=1 Tax=Branchiostoma lanceolatum TaxID=7740 RepID=A0A8J9VW29_BRALA|nr:Hypp707 [Branchiostoma lanceolatum]